MKTEENKRKRGSLNMNLNKDILNTKFISYINRLSDSITEYYNVSINIFQNKNIIIKSLEQEINNLKNKNNLSKEFKELFNELKININSNKINFINFFEDVQITFNEIKKYQNIIKNNKMDQRNFIISNSNLKNNTYESLYYHPEVNYKIDNSQNIIYIHKNNFSKIYRDIGNTNNFNKSKSRSEKRKKNQILNEEKLNNSYYLLLDKNTNIKSSKLIEKVEKLKNLNKNYEINIKKLNFELLEMKNSYKKNNLKIKNDNDDQKIQDELNINKDKIISSLKQELEKSNKKYIKISNYFKIFQTQIKYLKKENNKLTTLINLDNNQVNEFNNFVKESNKYKSNIGNIISLNYISRNRNKINSNSENIILNLKEEIISLKNKLQEKNEKTI